MENSSEQSELFFLFTGSAAAFPERALEPRNRLKKRSVRNIVIAGDGGDPHFAHAFFDRQVDRMRLVGFQGFAAGKFSDQRDIVRAVAVQKICASPVPPVGTVPSSQFPAALRFPSVPM